jgi:hypothetical protein
LVIDVSPFEACLQALGGSPAQAVFDMNLKTGGDCSPEKNEWQ